MKAYLHESAKKKHGLYTYTTLYHIARHYGVSMTETPDDANVILVSVDSAHDFPSVRTARRIAGRRPLIAGGFECFAGEYLLSVCDALVVGEGFEFFRELAHAPDIDYLYSLPFVFTRDKRSVTPSSYIDERILPVVKTANNTMYYLAARGCVGKCAFCATGYDYPLWRNSTVRLERAAKIAADNRCLITFITNDSESISVVQSAQSMRVKTYLSKAPRRPSKMLHFGIEGLTEERRKWFAKPITDKQVYDLVCLLSQRKQQAELFIICGFANDRDELDGFVERCFPPRLEMYPKIFIKMTCFDPCPHTPLWTYDIASLDYFTAADGRHMFSLLQQKNKSIRVFPIEAPVMSLYRSCLHRCAWHEVEKMPPLPDDRDDWRGYMASIRNAGLDHLITMDDRPAANSQIVSPHRRIRDRFASHLGMSPVTYWYDGNSSNTTLEQP